MNQTKRSYCLCVIFAVHSLVHGRLSYADSKVVPQALQTYPGYQTTFDLEVSAGSAMPTVEWFVSGYGGIDKNVFLATSEGSALMTVLKGDRQLGTATIQILPPTAKTESDLIADFEATVPIATVATDGIWQFFNAAGKQRRLVANPAKDQTNPSQTCAQADKVRRFASVGFASKDGVLLDGVKAVEVLIYGEDLIEVGWNIDMFEKPHSKGHKNKRERWEITLRPKQWNKILIPLNGLAGWYLRNIAVFPNPKSPDAGIFLLDEVRLHR